MREVVASFECYKCSYSTLTVEEDTCTDSQFLLGVPQNDINVTQCSSYCKKEIVTLFDEIVSVERSCSASCLQGCNKILGTGSCVYCCSTDQCNGSTTLHALPTMLCAMFAGLVLVINCIA
ncbi:U-scoloptoxin(05)-Er1a-like isoform X2 [Anneissia japonica]|uniref:U-scoloptoxin(05)-Er1a-like isoform X2 n=1 Tax=Anneissia japonica TaxID=1529436 RepID=UPI00142572B6|nr:U-scoloptoxin(05)-Er1a-like isoform X2 [Anneissia japonica]